LVAGTTTYTVIQRQAPKENIAALTVPVQAQSITLRITASGRVVPVQTVNISPKNPGILAQLDVEQGDRVEQGQVIARMSSKDIEARVQQARANLKQAQAQLAQAGAVGSASEIEQAQARLAQAEAQLAQARAGGSRGEVEQGRARLAQAEAQLAAARAGNRAQEIEQARAQVKSAEAQVNYTQTRVKRNQDLARVGAISRDQLDLYISEDQKARASLEEAQKRLSLVQSGTRTEEIVQREAAVAEAKAALRNLQTTRPEEIAKAEAGVAEARAALAKVQNPARPEEIAQRRAAVAASQAQLRAELVTLEDTVVRAPFAGIVTQKYANPGAYVAPATSASSDASATSTSIVAIARGLEILAEVPEADIGRIRSGQAVEIKSDAFPDQVFQGQVRLIAPEAIRKEGVTLFQVRVGLDTGQEQLRSGLNVDLTFLGDQVGNALMVPTVAIVTEKGNTGVLVPDERNKPQFRPVTIGAQVKDQTQIMEGVKQGERIFLNPPKDYQREQERQKQQQR
jgi:HlyD family secretion protein